MCIVRQQLNGELTRRGRSPNPLSPEKQHISPKKTGEEKSVNFVSAKIVCGHTAKVKLKSIVQVKNRAESLLMVDWSWPVGGLIARDNPCSV